MSIDSASEFLPAYKIMEAGIEVVREQPPSFETLRDLGLEAYFSNCEYGVQLSHVRQENNIPLRTVYNRGGENTIREPERVEQSVHGVYFHAHYQPEDTYIHRWQKKINSWYMLPSDVGMIDLTSVPEGAGSDVLAQMGTKTLGGYFNIITQHHLTLHVGIDVGSERVHDSQWEIVYGGQKGRVFTARQRNYDIVSKPDSVMVWAHHWPGGLTNYFLMINLIKAHEFEDKIGSVEGLCFGDGVSVLMEKLGLQNIPHAQNLVEITKLS